MSVPRRVLRKQARERAAKRKKGDLRYTVPALCMELAPKTPQPKVSKTEQQIKERRQQIKEAAKRRRHKTHSRMILKTHLPKSTSLKRLVRAARNKKISSLMATTDISKGQARKICDREKKEAKFEHSSETSNNTGGQEVSTSASAS